MGGDAISLDNTGLAFGLVTAAGLSTAIGAAAVFEKRIVKLASKPVLAAGLGFSGGVMLYVSFIEIFGKSHGAFLIDGFKEKDAYFLATLCLFAGMLILRLIQSLVHRIAPNHHCACDSGACEDNREISVNMGSSAVNVEDVTAPAQDAPAPAQDEIETGQAAEAKDPEKRDKQELQLMGLKTAIAIGLHNFPEGLATFVGTLADPAVGATLAIAIGIHNVPEGLCVALPIYYATDSRMKGFLWALLSGLSEPVGAFFGWAIIKSSGDDMNQLVYGILFGVVGGMMIMIVILELLPTACKYDPTDKCVSTSVCAGMLVMAASLCLFMA